MAVNTDVARRLQALDALSSDRRPKSAIELACIERQRNDLLHGHERGLVWCEEEVKRTLDLCTLVKHWKGEHGGQSFVPEPWQEHLLFAPLYGWWRECDGRLRRRFTTGYCEVPRKNGKTFTSSIIGLRGLVGDGENGPEVYSAASTRDQAGRLFDDMRQATLASRTLSNRIEARAHALLGKHNNGVAKAVSAEAKTLHGTNPSVAMLDELHAHPDDKVYEAMRSGQGARENPILFMITTAGTGRTSVCWEQHELSRQVLEGHINADSHFAYIATAEMTDDLQDPATWWKANPNLRVSVSEEFLRQESAMAAKMTSKENSFRRLHLNQWVEQEVRWLPMSAWDACDGAIAEEELEGRRCYAALDLASTRDVNALVLLFPLDDGRIAIIPHFWAPEEAMNERAERDRKQVCHWMREGYIRKTEGNVADFDGKIPADIMELLRPYDVVELGYDPWGSAQAVMQRLQSLGFPLDKLVEFRQTITTFAGPTKEFERLVYDRKLIHNNHPVLRWMASNVAVWTDASGNIRPNKAKSADKIDGIVAAIMALGVFRWREHAGPSVYEERGILVL